MHTRLHSLLACVALLLTLGCPPPAVYQTADTLEPGRWQIGGGLGVGAMRDDEQEIRVPTADVEVFARRGIVPDLDVGLRLYAPGVEASAKWRFKHDVWSMALMPGIAVLGTKESALITRAFHSFLTVPLLASRRLSRRWSLSLGPKTITGLYWSTTSRPTFGFSVGGYGAAVLRLGSWSILPELDLARTVAGTVPNDGWTTHVGIGLAWQR